MNTNKQNKLRKLQDKYIALLPAKIDELNSAWQATLHDSTELNQLCQLAHNLAGSAGTFGFPSISIESRNLEETLRKLGSDQDLDDTTKKNLADTVQRIISLAERGPDKREIVAPVRHEATPLTDKFERLIYVI